MTSNNGTADLFADPSGDKPKKKRSRNTAINQKRHRPDQADFDRDLAFLIRQSPVYYEAALKTAAENYGMSTSKLEQYVKKARAVASQSKDGRYDPPPLWDEPVDGDTLLSDVSQTLRHYCILPEGADLIIGLWIMFAHAHDAFLISPILAIQSPEKRCGKTTLLELISMLVPKPLVAGNITNAAMFRTINAHAPTLLLDEADTFLHGSTELRGALNAGQRKRTASVTRCEGDDHKSTDFSVWCPKVIAAIGGFPDTIQDRSIVIRMRRKSTDEKVARFREREKVQLDPLLSKAARWANDNLDVLRDADPDLPEQLNDRAQDNVFGLLAIADQIDPSIGFVARATLVDMKHAADAVAELPPQTQLLYDIRGIYAQSGKTEFSSRDLINELCKIEESPWSSYSSNRPITPKHLAGMLREFGVSSHKTSQARLYRLVDFESVFSIYLDIA